MICELYVLKATLPLYQGRESMELEEEFLLTRIVPKNIEKARKYGFMRRAYNYKLIGDTLYMRGADLVLRRVPWKEELYKILEENLEEHVVVISLLRSPCTKSFKKVMCGEVYRRM